jgi:PAS domain S-box-containing protein
MNKGFYMKWITAPILSKTVKRPGRNLDLNLKKHVLELFDEQTIALVTINFPNSYLILVEDDFTISFFSGQEAVRHNIDCDEYIGKPIENWYGPNLFLIHEKLMAAFAGEGNEQEEYIAGEYFNIHLVPLKIDNIIQRVMIIAQNITEKKQIQQTLEKRIGALTKPIQDISDVSFTDLFNIKDIQKIQDRFAQATGIASIITLPDGTPITKPSNFCRLCGEFIRNNSLGEKKCNLSDATLGRYSPSGPIVHPCMSSGLWNAGASITIGGRHLANWLIGQIRNETQTEEKMRKYARVIHADEDEFIKAYYEVPTMSIVQFKKISEVLFIMAEQLSTLAYQNVQQARFITEKAQVEQELFESEQRYRSYVNHSPYGVMTFDLAGNFLDANLTACSLTGFSEYELCQIQLQDLIVAEDFESAKQIQRLLFEKITGSLDIPIKKKDGAVRWWHIETTRLTDKKILMYVIDITTRKESETEILEKNEEVNNYFTLTQDLVCIVDEDGYIRRVNPEWENALGYCMDEMIGIKLVEYIHPEDIPSILEIIKQSTANGLIFTFKNRFRHKDGSFKWLEWRSSYIHHTLYASARDITHRIQSEGTIKPGM